MGSALGKGIKTHLYVKHGEPQQFPCLSLISLCGKEIARPEYTQVVNIGEREMPELSSLRDCGVCARAAEKFYRPEQRYYVYWIVEGQLAHDAEVHFNLFPAEQVAEDRGEAGELKGDTIDEAIHLVEKAEKEHAKEEN